MPRVKNVFTIPPGTPFLPRLAQFVLEGGATGLSPEIHDPLALTRTTIYLPTRRAVRSLRAEFSKLLGGKATFLPVLRTLGDSDEVNLEPFLPISEGGDEARVIDPLTRQVQLGRLVKRWVEAIGEEARGLFKDEDIIIPSSSGESLWLAKEVGDLIDQMETEEVSWERLNDLVPNKDQYANWWHLTLDFLQIAMKSWPQHLSSIGACNPASYRRQLLDLRTHQLTRALQPGPVIAAGSTGSIPATARFLKAVKELEQGAVILPGLDMAMSDDAWAQISQSSLITPEDEIQSPFAHKPESSEDHPQYRLAKLLVTMGVARDEVTILSLQNPALESRSRLTTIALLPSRNTDQWRKLMGVFDIDELGDATRDITIIDAPAERLEALAIALVLRQQIEIEDARAALVTPDRNLARRVAAELTRFNLNIDDSGGTPLPNTAPANFLRLLISVATQPANAATLASFVKSPLLHGDPKSSDGFHIARLFEICLLRDVLEIPAAGEFADAIAEFRISARKNQHLPSMIGKMNDEDWAGLTKFCEIIDCGLSPLSNGALENEPLDLVQLFEKLLTSINLLTRNDDTGSSLFHDDAGIELAALFEQIICLPKADFSCRHDELLSVFDALIAGKVVRSVTNTHPRISILGPLEARLQPLDCVILGGLNEGTWPAHHDSGPFLSRPMKTAIELATPEHRTGLAAHDFEQLFGCPKVFLTRAARVNNAPTVPSRWLQRLSAVCGSKITKQMHHRGNEYLFWASQIDVPDARSRRSTRPCPKPAVKHRPTRLSVTEIETWIRDPYAIYAKRILELIPLRKLGTIAQPALQGIILHEAMAEFVRSEIDPHDANAVAHLIAIIHSQVQANKVPGHMSALWMPRFHEVARAFVADEGLQKSKITTSYCETSAKLAVGTSGFELRGRADRVDLLNDGTVQIIDYKSGTNPTATMARTLAPQLALEGAMVMAGGFSEIGKGVPSALEYVRLRSRGEYKREAITNSEINAEQLSRKMLTRLERHITSYRNCEQGYISRFAVQFEQSWSGDYDHLARVREWSQGDEDD